MKDREESGQMFKSLTGYGFESVTPEHMYVLDLPSALVKRPSDDLLKALKITSSLPTLMQSTAGKKRASHAINYNHMMQS